MGAATLIIFVAVVHRYAAGPAISRRAGLAASPQHGLGAGTLHHHVRLDGQVRRRLRRAHRHPRRGRCPDQPDERQHARKFIIFGLLAGALFTGIVATLGASFVWENGTHYASFTLLGLSIGGIPEGPTTPDLEWPTWIVYSAVPLGSTLMCFRFLQVMVSFIRTGELPHHDHGHVEGLEDEMLPVDFDHLRHGRQPALRDLTRARHAVMARQGDQHERRSSSSACCWS